MTFTDGLHEVEVWLTHLDPLPVLWTEDEIQKMEKELQRQQQQLLAESTSIFEILG